MLSRSLCIKVGRLKSWATGVWFAILGRPNAINKISVELKGGKEWIDCHRG
jgi:hypothetical protein